MKTIRRLAFPLIIFCALSLPSRHSRAQQSRLPTVASALVDLDHWQLEKATAAAEILLYERPDDPAVLGLAAQVQHQRGEHMSAFELLSAISQRDASQRPSVSANIMASARYGAHFENIDTPHFKIRFLNKDRIVATYAQSVLEKAYARIGKALDFYPAEQGEKIAVEIYPNARGLSEATGLTVKEIETSGTIAVCKFHRLMITSPLATAAGYDWADTLSHEFVHLIVSKKSHDTIPIWLHEGIAKYHESLWSGEAGQALSPYSEKLLADAVRHRTLVPFAKMHPSMAKLPSQEQAALAFAEVFTVIEFIRKQFGEGAIPKILDTSASGIGIDATLKRVLGRDLAQTEADWKRYLSKRPFRIVPGAAPQHIVLSDHEEQSSENDPEKTATLEAIAEKPIHDQARLGELLQLRGHTAAAIVAYEKAYQQAGVRYPTLLNRLARAYAMVQRQSDAVRVIEALLAAHPDSADAHLLAGRFALQQKNYAGAQAHFESVIFLNPFNPEIFAALQRIYAKDGRTAEAQQAQAFFELANAPRKTRDYERPKPLPRSASVNIVTRTWNTPVRIDDAAIPVMSPAWHVPLEPGAHHAVYIRQDGTTGSYPWVLKPDDHLTIRLE